MSEVVAPIVYAGPTIDRATIERLLPDCQVRPPIQRTDLYTERMLGGSLFLLLDGVFHQQQAVPPREIVDVLQDGAAIYGASSMGALRAAECWPAGMRGVGSIYRLFRAGRLGSDDEVAVVFDGSGRFSSVALINVRYAASRLVRAGEIDGAVGRKIVAAAVALFYADRTWATILGAAGLGGRRAELEPRLASLDLKRLDAERALRVVARLPAEGQAGEPPRTRLKVFVTSEMIRESPYDPLEGRAAGELKREFIDWVFASGRYRRYAQAAVCAAASRPGAKLVAARADPAATARTMQELLASEGVHTDRDAKQWRARWGYRAADLTAAAALHDAGSRLFSAYLAGGGELAVRLWAELGVNGELDAELMRFRAINHAAEQAGLRHLKPSALNFEAAAQEIAAEHGFASWVALEADLADRVEVSAHVSAYRDRLAIAKQMRDVWFTGNGPLARALRTGA